MARHLSGVVNLDAVYQWIRRQDKKELAHQRRAAAISSEGAYEACGYRAALQDLAALLGINWQEVENLGPFAK